MGWTFYTSSGQVMTATTTTSSGGLTLIGTVVADDDADLTITGLDSTYDTYMIAISDLVGETDGNSPTLRVGDSGGVDSGATDYAFHYQRIKENSDLYVGASSTGATSIQFSGDGVGNAAGEGFGAVLWLHRPGDGTMFPTITGTMAGYSNSSLLHGGALIASRSAVITLDRIQVIMDAGNITSGRLTVWGVAHA